MKRNESSAIRKVGRSNQRKEREREEKEREEKAKEGRVREREGEVSANPRPADQGRKEIKSKQGKAGGRWGTAVQTKEKTREKGRSSDPTFDVIQYSKADAKLSARERQAKRGIRRAGGDPPLVF
ncbi:MAG: hypothetical protein AAGK22_27080 [Acidobacteriota bacterium]